MTLNPCPFCASTAVIDGGEGEFYIFCETCLSEGPWCKTPEEAAERWNRASEAARVGVALQQIIDRVAPELANDRVVLVWRSDEGTYSAWRRYETRELKGPTLADALERLAERVEATPEGAKEDEEC